MQSLPQKDQMVSWFDALKHSWRAALRIDRSQVTTVAAIRGVIGFVLPLAIGVLTGHVVEGVSIAGGAATLGAVGLTYTHHARTRLLLLACVGIAISAFVGSVTGHIGWLSVLVIGIWGIGAGLLVSLGQTAMIIGLQSVIALIILSHFELDPLHAALQAALMFAGALFQTLLVLVPLPWQHTATERSVLSTAYQKLADYALDPVNEPIRDALLKVDATLSDSNIGSRQGKMFFGLLEEAEHIRLSLLVLARLRQNLSGDTVVEDYLDQILQATASELRKIANELKPVPIFVRPVKPHQQIKQLLTMLRRQEIRDRDKETIQQILAYCDVLREQLYTARKLATSWKYPRQEPPVAIEVPQQTRAHLHNAQTILRANLTLRSTVFRHAIRLGVALAFATALYRIFPLPIQRGYWIPLTVLLVLKPEFTTTFTRGLARALGTMLGAVLTTLLASLLAPTQGILVVLDALAAYLAFSFLYANYAIFSVFITMETVLLLTLVIPEPLMTAADRAIDTAIGGVLALLIYAIWPTWEETQVPRRIADRLETLRQYFVVVMDTYANPDSYDQLTIYNLRVKSRLARSNAQASVDRSLQEPEPHRIDRVLHEGLLEATENIARNGLALEAYLLDKPERHALPQVTSLTAKVDEALRLLAAAIREDQPITTFPDLQEALHTLKHAEKSAHHMPDETRATLRFVLSEAKSIIRSINTMKQLLSSEPAVREVHA